MIEINNLTKKKIDVDSLKKVGQSILKKEKRNSLDISVALVGQSVIKEINNKYRKQSKPTDVLSFFYGDSGEIIICPDVVEGGKKGLTRVFIHGILHILGYDHEKTQKEAKAMQIKENYYLLTQALAKREDEYLDSSLKKYGKK